MLYQLSYLGIRFQSKSSEAAGLVLRREASGVIARVFALSSTPRTFRKNIRQLTHNLTAERSIRLLV